MSNTELIVWQASRIAELQISVDYWSNRCTESEKNSIKAAPLSFSETVSALAHAEVSSGIH